MSSQLAPDQLTMGTMTFAADVRHRPTARGVLFARPGSAAVHLNHQYAQALIDRQSNPTLHDEVHATLTASGFLATAHADGLDALADATSHKRVGSRRIAVTRSGLEIDVVHPISQWLARRIGPLRLSAVRWAVVMFAVGGVLAWVVHASMIGVSSEAVVARYGATTVFLVLGVARIVATIIHELAHATVASAGGARVGRLGLGLYWGGISAYVDSTDALVLPRRTRLWQAAAGAIVEGVLTAMLAITAVLNPAWADLCWRLAAIGAGSVLLNLVPLLQLDGYWLLSDWRDDPELHERAQEQLATALRHRRIHPGCGRLTAYGAISLTAGLVLLVSSIWLWWSLAQDLISSLWAMGGWQRIAAAWVAIPTALSFIAALTMAIVPSVVAWRTAR